MTTLNLRIARIVEEAEDIRSFELVGLDGCALPPYSAGAHIDVVLGPGLIRQYSLWSDPLERYNYRIAVLREAASRGGSAAMHGLREGDVLSVSEPRNHFPLVVAPEALLFAGGIGITPMLCMAMELARAGTPYTLHYAARTAGRMAFRSRLSAGPFVAHTRLYADDAPDSGRLDIGAALAAAGPGAHLYVCGPAGFIDAVTGAASSAGWDQQRIHFEYFAAKPVDHGSDGAFQVRIASSGACHEIPAGRSVVEVLAEHGVDIPVSCEQGVCGTCITRVLEGVPDHKDSYFTADEQARNDQFTPCCSRARTPVLVLDL